MKLTRRTAQVKKKHGIKLWVYPIKRKEAGVAYVEVAQGHLQEFYDTKSTFIYYIIEGRGGFYLNGKRVAVKATDLITIPPMTKIYYMGKMKMILTTIPAWHAKNEVHVRFIKQPKKHASR
ncbi:MAG: AraC family ligand binding domain-containing protein [Candidatus Kerfeldbacteria bacterium]|nr:AraC family ligand binding domain-containing protein [Candidatus Kerfeldbacteria bacterium]